MQKFRLELTVDSHVPLQVQTYFGRQAKSAATQVEAALRCTCRSHNDQVLHNPMRGQSSPADTFPNTTAQRPAPALNAPAHLVQNLVALTFRLSCCAEPDHPVGSFACEIATNARAVPSHHVIFLEPIVFKVKDCNSHMIYRRHNASLRNAQSSLPTTIDRFSARTILLALHHEPPLPLHPLPGASPTIKTPAWESRD